MKSSRSTPSKTPLLFGILLTLLVLGGAAWLLLDSGGGPEPGAGTAVAPAPEPEEPRFNAQPPAAAEEASPITLQPDVVSSEAPVLAQDPRDPTGCLEGRVESRDGLPVAGALLTTFKGNALLTGNFPGTRKRVDVEALSDGGGHFKLCGIPKGDAYVLVAEHEGYARTEMPGLRIVDGQTTAGVVLRLSDGAVVQGMVVEAGTELPLGDARVELYYTLDVVQLRPEDQKPWKVVFTNPEGRFAFAHVSGNSLRVRVSAEGYETQSVTRSYALEGEARDETLKFELVQGVSLPGRVVDPRGLGIAGARVEANSQTKEFQGHSVAYSDENGYFLLEGLSEKIYALHATADGYSDTTRNKVTVTVGQIQLEMQPRGEVAGKVATRSGAPVTAFELQLLRQHAEREATYINQKQDFRSDDGSFLFDNIEPGTYVLEARAGGFADSRSAAFTIQREDQVPARADILMTRGGTLAGVVLSPDGKPASGATVELNENGYQDSSIAEIFAALAPSGERVMKTRTDNFGRFTFENIRPGPWQVAAKHAGAAPLVLNDVQVADDETGSNAPLEMRLPPGAVIAGRAVDDTSTPLTFTKVQIVQKGTGFMQASSTDQDGFFRFDSLLEGTYTLTVNPQRLKDQAVNPLLQLVYAQKSSKDVFVGQGQQIQDALLVLPTQ